MNLYCIFSQVYFIVVSIPEVIMHNITPYCQINLSLLFYHSNPISPDHFPFICCPICHKITGMGSPLNNINPALYAINPVSSYLTFHFDLTHNFPNFIIFVQFSELLLIILENF